MIGSASLRTDLALARAEVEQLREERGRLLAQVRRVLGSALENRDRESPLEQVRDLERQRNLLNSERLAARADLARSEEHVQFLGEELPGRARSCSLDDAGISTVSGCVRMRPS